MKLCDIKKCTGCGACVNICPKGAISLTEEDTGKMVWAINDCLCVMCGLCAKTCPAINNSDFATPIKSLASWTLNENDRKTCASGGIATAFYRMFLDDGGVIYGCDYDDNLKPIIRRTEKVEDIEKFKSSKYVQSSTEYSYKQVKKDLADGRNVLYVGTPCQVDGLNHFLGACNDNLVTVDIICHGVPPYKYLQEYVGSICTKKRPTSISFRGKYDYYLGLYAREEQLVLKKAEDDLYFRAFQNGTIFRDNCYQCKYAGKDRISDLTIGDFWGINRKRLKKQYDGKISLILVNTLKGQKIIEKAQRYIYTEERSLDEATRYNEQLNHPMTPPEDREIFLKNYKKGVRKALKSTPFGKEITRRKIKSDCKNIFKRK